MSEIVINEISIYSQQLIDLLGQKEINEVVSYEEMSNLIGVDIQSAKGRGYLSTARKRLLKDEKMVFGTIRKEGVKRLDDETVVKTAGRNYLTSMRKRGRVAYQKNTSVDYHALSDTGKIDHQCTMTILGLMNHITSRSSVHKIHQTVHEKQEEISQKETLRLLRQPLMNGSE